MTYALIGLALLAVVGLIARYRAGKRRRDGEPRDDIYPFW